MKTLAQLKEMPVQHLEAVTEVTSKVRFSSRDEIELNLKLSGTKLMSAEIKSIACPECLDEIKRLKINLKAHSQDFSKMPLPNGNHHSAILMRELILRSRNQWAPPYEEPELCHCRKVDTAIVDAAIVGGLHNVVEIGEKTMAGTACGTCRPVSQMLIDYRLDDD